jgi:SAM-dependent methyltransferase
MARNKSPRNRPRGRQPSGISFVRDAELEAGSDAHYGDPRYYASTYADRDDDVAYYVTLASAHGGPVLEYGCGNGRILLPLAQSGLQVTGVDRSVSMIADLRQRLRKLEPAVRKRVRARRGDMRSVNLKQRFPLVLCTFNTFLHLYTRHDVERFCARVLSHLTRKGRFVVDVSMPVPEELARKPENIQRTPRFKHPTTGEVVRYGERFDYDALRQVLLVSMEFEPRDRPKDGWMTPLAHRQFFPQELEALLHYNGLEVIDVHGDFVEASPEQDAAELIFHCKRRRGF